MPFPDRDETLELNDEIRRTSAGSFISLQQGVTHYEVSNPQQLETVVLVHGFSVPYFIYDTTFAFLTQSGFRMLRYDLFGRGLSDRPQTHYTLDLFVQQLTDLLDALRLTRPVSLIGLSMGGPITTGFTLRHPERVDKLVLIDPAGVTAVPLTWMMKLAKLPLVAEAALSVVGGESLIQNAARDFFDPALVEHFIPRYREQMQYKGFKRALLSTLRHGMLDSFIDLYRALGRSDKRVLLLWGRHDTTTPFENSQSLRTAIPQVEFQVIEECGHIPHYEKPEVVNPLLLNFLR